MSTSQLQQLVATSENRQIESPIDWTKRHVDPMIMMRWNSATEVIPANRAQGITSGTIVYPDQTRQTFTLQ